jgi:hypothetical protein
MPIRFKKHSKNPDSEQKINQAPNTENIAWRSKED